MNTAASVGNCWHALLEPRKQAHLSLNFLMTNCKKMTKVHTTEEIANLVAEVLHFAL